MNERTNERTNEPTNEATETKFEKMQSKKSKSAKVGIENAKFKFKIQKALSALFSVTVLMLG